MKFLKATSVIAVLIAGLMSAQNAFCDGGGGYESNEGQGSGAPKVLLSFDWEALVDLQDGLEHDDREDIDGATQGIEGH